jgi:hypothetical protein
LKQALIKIKEIIGVLGNNSEIRSSNFALGSDVFDVPISVSKKKIP